MDRAKPSFLTEPLLICAALFACSVDERAPNVLSREMTEVALGSNPTGATPTGATPTGANQGSAGATATAPNAPTPPLSPEANDERPAAPVGPAMNGSGGSAGQGSMPSGADEADSAGSDPGSDPTADPNGAATPPPTPPANIATLLWAVGGEGIGPGLFDDARFVGVDGTGVIYVAEFEGEGPGRVQRFAADGSFSSQWSVVDTAIITDLVADRNGIVYVNQGGTITRFEGATGRSLGVLTLPQYSDSPLAIALTPDNGLLTVARTQMLRLDSSLRVVLDVDTIGPALDDSIFIHSAAMDGAGNIFVAATFEPVVFQFDGDGTFRDRIGLEGSGVGRFESDGPDAIAVDGRGRIYAADYDGIEVFEADGSSRGLIPADPGILGLAVSDRNELVAIHRNNATLLKYALSL